MVPGAGFEPARLSTEVFETTASAVPPPGRKTELYPKHSYLQEYNCVLCERFPLLRALSPQKPPGSLACSYNSRAPFGELGATAFFQSLHVPSRSEHRFDNSGYSVQAPDSVCLSLHLNRIAIEGVPELADAYSNCHHTFSTVVVLGIGYQLDRSLDFTTQEPLNV